MLSNIGGSYRQYGRRREMLNTSLSPPSLSWLFAFSAASLGASSSASSADTYISFSARSARSLASRVSWGPGEGVKADFCSNQALHWLRPSRLLNDCAPSPVSHNLP